MKYKVGDKVFYVKDGDDGRYVNSYKDEEGNFGVAKIKKVGTSVCGLDSLDAVMVSGRHKGMEVILLLNEVIPFKPLMKILKVKRSEEGIGLKVYGKVMGESGKAYNFAYIRRTGFRGWICSCEDFFFNRATKNQNCKHLRFVRKHVGRYAATVQNESTIDLNSIQL